MNIWLILERGHDAQDNAWHFFKYLKDYHPEINSKYAIVKSSPDYKTNLSKYQEDVIEYGSLLYFVILYNSSYLISTHLQTYVYFNGLFSWLSHSAFDIKAKKVFLQHGITHNFHPTYEYPKLNVQLFISGANNEYLLLTSLFKYPQSVVKYTGFARFDNLFNFEKKRVLLIMPTWRAKYTKFSKADFEQTDFYLSYKEILTDVELLTVLNQCRYDLLFYNHIEFQKFNSSFETLCSDRVRLVRFGEIKVQDLLKEASLLVTDYSSVYYDFFYMKKPILFFKLNKDDFESSQYGRDYDTPDEFGYVAYNPRMTIKTIIELLHNDCLFEERFLEHHKQVFPVYDNHNCERTFDAIVNL
jgi:CDP-glycerol glycerophosphotransferase (TagB/SpsB family)